MTIEGHRIDRYTFMYADNLCKRVGAELEILSVVRPEDEQLLEQAENRLKFTLIGLRNGIVPNVVFSIGNLEEEIIKYVKGHKEILLTIASNRDVGSNLPKRLNCPLVVISQKSYSPNAKTNDIWSFPEVVYQNKQLLRRFRVSRILLLGQNLDIDSLAIRYATELAKGKGGEIVSLIPVSPMESSLEPTIEWIEAQERRVKEEMEKAKRHAKEITEYFDKHGIACSSQVIKFEKEKFMEKMEALMPVDLVITDKVEFPSDLGIKSITDLSTHFNCPVIDAEAMYKTFKPVSAKVWMKFLLYGIGSAFMYFVFFPHLQELNKFYMAGSIIGGIAIMVTAAIHAWVYGNTMECLLKFIKLDK